VRFLPAVAALLVLGMTAAAVWAITDTPGVVDEVPLTPQPSPPAEEPQPIPLTVQQGQGVEAIGKMLEDAGVVESGIQFRVLVSLLGYDGLLQAGDYEFEPNTPALEAVYRMRRGILSSLFVTVVEGWRLEEIAEALDADGTISGDDFLEAALAGNFTHDYLAALGPLTPLEGYLFPATYFYRRGSDAEALIKQMLDTMDRQFSQKLRDRATEQGLTMHSVLTLASIIEREARVAGERPIMAQVFLTRLRRGIPLEADPTVQYALAEDPGSADEFGYWKSPLTGEDLEVASEYNTYRQLGLPPTPIAAPRLDSILAVIEPADTNFLYFVAKPDGSHAFAETLEEHQRNIEEFLP
jgi:UPF0755 protein